MNHFLKMAGAFATYPVATWHPLAWVFLALALLFVLTYAEWPVLLPMFFLLEGMVLVTFWGAVWIAWHRRSESLRRVVAMDAVFSSVFLVVLLLQVQWTAHAVRADVHGPYDGGPEAARFLHQAAKGKTVVAFYDEAVTIEPYFQANIFANRETTYLRWDLSELFEESPAHILALHPQFLVMARTTRGPQNLVFAAPGLDDSEMQDETPPAELWLRAHFRETHRFCGTELARNGVANLHCQLVFEPPPGDER